MRVVVITLSLRQSRGQAVTFCMHKARAIRGAQVLGEFLTNECRAAGDNTAPLPRPRLHSGKAHITEVYSSRRISGQGGGSGAANWSKNWRAWSAFSITCRS
jgi:hypothetical protein